MGLKALSLAAAAALGLMALLMRFAAVTGYLEARLLKDPPRTIPTGRVIVAPADGTVLYVRSFSDGIIPEVVKKGVAVPVADLTKDAPERAPRHGVLIGIYMSTFGVHVNRVPDRSIVRSRTVFNGPHMSMTAAERKIAFSQLIPGWLELRKIAGLPPFPIENDADYILRSARETLVFEDEHGLRLYVVRIADYSVGKIVTWVRENEAVERGQKLGMITWGSQTDLLIEGRPSLSVRVRPGDRVKGGASVLAAY